jgi:hypothetical protein
VTPIMYILTDSSAVQNPSVEQPNPLIGMKNPNGVGAFLGVSLFANGSAGAQVVQLITDQQIIDGESPSTRGNLPTMSRLTGFVGPNNEFAPLTITLAADGYDGELENALSVAGYGYLFNGTLYDRMRASSAQTQDNEGPVGALLVAQAAERTAFHSPAVGVRAVATQAAVAGAMHICRSITASIVAGAAAQGQLQVVLRDGATGVGTILWSDNVACPAAESDRITIAGMNISGTPGNAMTLEFVAAGVATTFESVAMSIMTAPA